MTMPGFFAEASLYKTDNHYKHAVTGGILLDGSTTVIPQDCPAWKWGACAAAVGGCTAGCVVAGSPSAEVAFFPCMLGCLAGLGMSLCNDCIEEESKPSGSGGAPPGSADDPSEHMK